MKALNLNIQPPENWAVSFIIKTSFDCNLRCSYCYEGRTVRQKRISLETVKNLTEKAAEYSKQNGTKFAFVWHGGEPLLMGQKFYEEAKKMQLSAGADFIVDNALQTNGVLLTDQYAKSLIENGYGVGVSLDGPPTVHELQRPLSNQQKGSFLASYKALQRLYQQGYYAGCIVVLTKNTIDHLDEVYDFFRDRELSFKINPLFVAGRAESSKHHHLRITPEEFKNAALHIFNRWISDEDKTFNIQPFTTIIQSMISGENRTCAFAGRCNSMFKLFPNGDVHLCGMEPYDKYKVGNINEDSMDDLMSSPYRKQYGELRNAVIETCRKTCEHVAHCHAGCVQESYQIRKRLTDKTYYCKSYRAIFARIKEAILAHEGSECRLPRQNTQCTAHGLI